MAMIRPFVPLAFLFLPALVAPLAAQQGTVEAAAESKVEPILSDAMVDKIIKEGIDNSQVMRILRDLTSKVGHRLTGSDNFTKACYWAVDEFKAMGLDAHMEKWAEWKLVWNRGPWVGRIVQPTQVEMYVATEAWTAGTKGLQRGELRRAPKTAEEFEAAKGSLKGAFLWRSGRVPADIKSRCEEAGILGWVYGAQGDAKYPTRVRVFGNHQTAMKTMADVPTVPEIAVRSDNAKELADLLGADKPVVVEFDIQNSFREGPIELHNVIAEIKGSEKPDEVVIVCGHLDSWHQATGTTDNGTGTNTTLESARILAAVKAKPKRTIRFCLWGGEEQGLLGSRAYVTQHRSEMEKVSAVFNHDTGTNWAHSLTVADTMYEPMLRVFAPITNERLTPPDQDHEGPVFKLNKNATISGGGGSDHASFIAAGVPGLNWNLKGRSDYFGYTWHTQWDTIDVAIEEYQRHTATVIALAALGTADLPEILDRSGVVRSGGGRQGGAFATGVFDAEMDGLTFKKVNKDGRADKMGIKDGDVIQKVNGKAIKELFEIFTILRDDQPEELVFTLKRGDGTAEAKLKASELGRGGRRRGGEQGGGQGGNRGGERGGD